MASQILLTCLLIGCAADIPQDASDATCSHKNGQVCPVSKYAEEDAAMSFIQTQIRLAPVEDLPDAVLVEKPQAPMGLKVSLDDELSVSMAKAYAEQLLMRWYPELVLTKAKAFPLPNWVESMTCTMGHCYVSGPASGGARKRIDRFLQDATAEKIVSDKVFSHSYQTMYGMYLVPSMEAISAPKLFEIGLGCDMDYGPGASVALWKSLFPNASVWEAEFNAECVRRSQAKGLLTGIDVVTGDQGHQETVQRWVVKSGGHFDAVIDDGGHRNMQIRTSFETLWPHVKPGGLYFLEDLHVGRNPNYVDGGVVISDMVQAWVEQLLTQNRSGVLPLPDGVETIFIQNEACMLSKRGG